MDYAPPYIPGAVISNPPGRGLVSMGEAATAGAEGPMLVLPGRGSIEGVRFTAHPRGGGYIGFLQQRTGKAWSPNQVAYRFGRGIQVTIRDRSPWNPNPAGFRETVGTPVRLTKTPTSLSFAPFRVPLFQNQEFDFTEKENEAQDDFASDAGRDADKLNDAAHGLSRQYDEVMSEAQLAGVYTRQSTFNGIPAVRYQYRFSYEWPYGAMAQFHTDARTEDGPNWSPGDTVNGFTDTDWCSVIMSMGLRMADIPGWTYTHYSVGGTIDLRSTPRSSDERRRTYIGTAEGMKTTDPLDNAGRPIAHRFDRIAPGLALGIMATSGNANTARAIGLYMPKSLTNIAQVKTQTGEENRRVSTGYLFVRDGTDPPESNMVLRTVISGVRPGEALFGDVVLLFGTPNEILLAARYLEINP